jgi:hypothetical protein
VAASHAVHDVVHYCIACSCVDRFFSALDL